MFGIIKDTETGTCDLADDYVTKRCYLFGDVKTVDNIAMFTEMERSKKAGKSSITKEKRVQQQAWTRKAI